MTVISAPLFAHIAVAAALALPTSPSNPSVYAQFQQSEGHYHEGEIGVLYMQIEKNIKCDCGCNLDVHSCQFQMQCGTSPVWSARILRELEEGRTVEAIEAGFVADFGPQVLVAPPAEGFNLVGYLLPALAIVTVGILMGLMIRGGARGTTVEVVPASEVSADEEERIRAAMKKMDEAESPDW